MSLYAPIRIIFADDHEAIREGFHAMLKNTDIEIVGEAKNGQQLLMLARQMKPDIIVSDILMPEMDGIDATVEIVKEFPGIGVIAYSMSNEESLIVDMLKAGAKGYILKNSGKEEIIAAIKSVYKGQEYYCRETDSILTAIRNRNKSKTRKLNHKEIMIIRLICQQMSSQEIADVMNLSARTVEGYRRHIIEKTRAKNIAGIVLYAIRNNIFQFRK